MSAMAACSGKHTAACMLKGCKATPLRRVSLQQGQHRLPQVSKCLELCSRCGFTLPGRRLVPENHCNRLHTQLTQLSDGTLITVWPSVRPTY
jgi:hypothetical protein